MIEIALKFSAVAAVAWAVTRGVRPANAAAARGIWLVTLASPLFLPLLTPAVFLRIAPARATLALAPPSQLAWLPGALTVVYVIGLLVLVARVGSGWWQAARIIRAARPLAEEEAARLRAIARAPGLRLAESTLDGPVTAGIFSPIVLLPRGWRALPETMLAAILRHEAAHARRRDPAAALFASLVHAALWLTPAATIARRELLRFAELAADGAAAASMPGCDYAGALLRLANGRRLGGMPLLEARGSESSIARRVRLVLDDEEFGRPGPARMRAAVAAILAALLIAACVRPASHVSTPGQASTSVEDGGALYDHAARHAARHARH